MLETVSYGHVGNNRIPALHHFTSITNGGIIVNPTLIKNKSKVTPQQKEFSKFKN